MKMSTIVLLRSLFPSRDKKVIGVLLFASVLVSFIETISLSAIMGFIALITNFDLIQANYYFKMVYDYGEFTNPRQFIVMIGACLLVFYLVRAVLNVLYLYYMNKFAQMRQHYFAARLFKHYLQLPYRLFVQQTSAQLVQTIFAYSTNIAQIVSSFLTMSSEFFTVALIYTMLFYVNWKMTCVLTVFLAAQVMSIIRPLSKRITAAGMRSRKSSLYAGKIFTESFWNFKYVKLINGIGLVFKRFDERYRSLARANMVNAVWEGLPRLILETTAFCMLISVMMYIIYSHYDLSFFIPIISMYALAFYRFMPSLNKIVGCYNKILFNKHVIEPVHHFLQQEVEEVGSEEIPFDRAITIKKLLFYYKENQPVLHNVSLTIKKGSWVGFVGESGSGKSTLVDIIMGFFQPQQGIISVDNKLLSSSNIRSWRSKIGYIPQTVFLFDGTIAENVVCGRAHDEKAIVEALQRAQIYDFLKQKEGIETQVGEGGINLSGGQKQRIAIARALYGEPEILVLDEATSALDNETEKNIMNEIYANNRDKTLLIIAHRVSTLDRCDQIYSVEKGVVKKVKDTNQGAFVHA